MEANCAYPYGKSVDNFAMGGIERAAVYFGKCLAPNFNINAGISAGNFYNGNKFSFQTKLNYRIEPIFQSSFNISYDKIDLPLPFDSAELWLIGPKINFTFTKELFWSNYIQYSSLNESVGINSRLQWRFAPLSDFYLVYNDNYFASNIFAPKLRSLTFKLSYWFNF